MIEKTKSYRAANTLAEFYLALSQKEPENAELAAKHYMISAEQGCLLGMHWMGYLYYEGKGVSKNVDKALELLTKAAKLGNGQSYY